MLQRAPDGHIYVTVQSAAEAVGVDRTTVLGWRRRGLLKIALTHEGRPFYRLKEVMAAEQAAREAAIRTSGTDARVRRRGKLYAPIPPSRGGA